MPTGTTPLRTYLALADWYEGQSQAQMRDRFLLLAADTALAEGQPDEAERLRLRLLEHSPHHMLRPFTSFAEALHSPDVQGYLNDLRQTYPPETAEQLLGSLRAEQLLGSLRAEEAGQPPPAPRPAPRPEPAQKAAEPLKVYRVRDEDAEAAAPRPAPAAAPPRRPAPVRNEVLPAAPAPPVFRGPAPALRPTPAAAPRPPTSHAGAAAPPSTYPLRPEPAAARPAVAPPTRRPSAEDDEAAERGGGWVAAGLFVLVLLAGSALAAYTFARPFLPPQWLP